MNLLKTIIFIGLGILLVNCGGQDNSANTVKVATVENGVPKTEDGRIILSSQAEDNSLVIEEGWCEGCVVSSQKLEEEIASKLNSVSEVYDVSFTSGIQASEVFAFFIGRYFLSIFEHGNFNSIDAYWISFTVKTVSGTVYKDIECIVKSTPHLIRLLFCQNDQVVLGEENGFLMSIRFDKIVIGKIENNKPRIF